MYTFCLKLKRPTMLYDDVNMIKVKYSLVNQNVVC